MKIREKRQDQVKHLANILFLNADKDGNKQLDFEETKTLLQELHININKKYLINLFAKYDANNNGQIDQGEFVNIIRDINKKEELIQIFTVYCPQYNQHEQQDHLGLMTPLQYQEFFRIEQQQDLPIEDIVQLFKQILNYQDNNLDTVKLLNLLKISFYQFSNILFSDENCIFIPQKQTIYQDMNQPLTDYFINSSHNTYLTSNQFSGSSSCQAYINAFQKGCRCVEIDIWDGEKGDPIVTHGHTLTTKIPFKTVIETINQYAFQYSVYPLILSFENHCSIPQQKVMANIILNILKDKLYVLPVDWEKHQNFKSPNQLKHKILIKSKGSVTDILLNVDSFIVSEEDDDDYEIFSENDLNILSKNSEYLPNYLVSEVSKETFNTQGTKFKMHLQQQNYIKNMTKRNSEQINVKIDLENSSKTLKNKQFLQQQSQVQQMNLEKKNNQQDPLNYQEIKNLQRKKESEEFFDMKLYQDLLKQKELQNARCSQKLADLQKLKEINQLKQQENKTVQLCKELLRLSTMFGCKLNIFDENRIFWQVSSISEILSNKLIKKYQEEFIEFNKKHILRVYPCCLRLDSSNYDPVPFFVHGVQQVALNVQTNDFPMLLNLSKFQENGGIKCGYVLKPECLKGKNKNTTHQNINNIQISLNADPTKPQNDQQLLYPFQMTEIKKIIQIQVISGQQLRPDNYENDTFDVVDPYVQIFIRGTKNDEQLNKPRKTRIISDNGFHPIWNSKIFEFKLTCPELDILVFRVMDSDIITDTQLGQYALPVETIRPGYRIVPLRNKALEFLENSYILVKISIQNIQ